MLKDLQTHDAEAFLEQLATLPVDGWERIETHDRVTYPIRRQARPILKLGAADFSWLDKLVRDMVGPSMAALRQVRLGFASDVLFIVERAAQAIVRRDRLSEEQYEAFVGGFRQVGIDVPGWRDGWAASAGGVK